MPALVGFLLLLVTGVVIAIIVARIREGRVSAICTLTSVLLFASVANALPALYGRFFVVPLLLGIAPSVATLRQGRVPRTIARFLKRSRPGHSRLAPPQPERAAGPT
jgi:hypothetical protein